jgi:hypothetical protein
VLFEHAPHTVSTIHSQDYTGDPRAQLTIRKICNLQAM